jgi:Fur family transcriptional regulator, ferric uptake regulator
MTSERRHILQHVFAAHTHFEAEDLHMRLRAAGHRVAKATVYRTLALMLEAGILRPSIAPPGADSAYYELAHGLDQQHEHLQCQDCGRIVEVTDSGLTERLGAVALGMGFELVDHSVKLVGRCRTLRDAGWCKHQEDRSRS